MTTEKTYTVNMPEQVHKKISELECGDLFVGLDHRPSSNNGQPLPEELCIVTMDMEGNFGYVELNTGNFYVTNNGMDHFVCPVKQFKAQITLA